MARTVTYKGYVASVEFSPEDELIVGRVVNTKDSISFHAEAASAVLTEFHAIIDSYLASCQELGTEPDKPYSGKLLLRLSPELHGRLAAEAARVGWSINTYAEFAIRRTVEEGADRASGDR